MGAHEWERLPSSNALEHESRGNSDDTTLTPTDEGDKIHRVHCDTAINDSSIPRSHQSSLPYDDHSHSNELHQPNINTNAMPMPSATATSHMEHVTIQSLELGEEDEYIAAMTEAEGQDDDDDELELQLDDPDHDPPSHTSPPAPTVRSFTLSPYTTSSTDASHSIQSVLCRFLPPRRHLSHLIRLSLPNAAGLVVDYMLNVVNLAFVGRLGPDALAGAALANSFMNLSGFAVTTGLCYSVDTLCAQGVGAGRKRWAALVARRAALAFTLAVIPILILWSQTASILQWSGQDAEICMKAGKYVTISSSTIFANLYIQVIRRFLQAHAITRPQVVIATIANAVHAALCWILIFRADMGLIGAPIAYSLTLWFQLGLYIIYVWRWFDGSAAGEAVTVVASASESTCTYTSTSKSHTDTNVSQRPSAATSPNDTSSLAPADHPHSDSANLEAGHGAEDEELSESGWRSLTHGWLDLYRLGIPGLLMLVLEWGSFELMALGSGRIGSIELDTFVVAMNLAVTAYMFPLAIGISASTLVGNALGAGQPKQAQLFARAALILGLGFVGIELVIVSAVRGQLARVFTNDPDVINMFKEVALLLLLLMPGDALAGVQGGVMRGAGFQSLGAATNLCSYWLLGLPLGFVLAFVAHVGVRGLLTGLCAAVVMSASVYTWKIASVDWVEESKKAVRRIEEAQTNKQRQRPSHGLHIKNSSITHNMSNGHGSNTSSTTHSDIALELDDMDSDIHHHAPRDGAPCESADSERESGVEMSVGTRSRKGYGRAAANEEDADASENGRSMQHNKQSRKSTRQQQPQQHQLLFSIAHPDDDGDVNDNEEEDDEVNGEALNLDESGAVDGPVDTIGIGMPGSGIDASQQYFHHHHHEQQQQQQQQHSIQQVV